MENPRKTKFEILDFLTHPTTTQTTTSTTTTTTTTTTGKSFLRARKIE